MKTIQEFHDSLINLQPINLLEFQEVISELQIMSSCDQSPKSHAEGNVLIHVNMALEKVLPLLDQVEDQDDKVILYIATMLHDIGKKAVFAISPKHGRITAYGHETAGLPIANEFLKKYFPEFDYKKREKILRLIENHMKPRMMAKDGGLTPIKLKMLSLAVNTKLLYLLSQADTTGRKAEDNASGLALLEAFRTECEKLDVWDRLYNIPNSGGYVNATYSLARWHILINNALESRETLDKADILIKKMPKFQLLMLVGAPGCGKTTFRKQLQVQYPDAVVISMDEKREELCGDMTDQSRNDEIFNWQLRTLTQCMQKRQNVILDSTNTTRKKRKLMWQIARRYGALCGAVYFDLSLETILQRNANRDRKVPVEVIEKFFKWQESLLPYECDQLFIVDK